MVKSLVCFLSKISHSSGRTGGGGMSAAPFFGLRTRLGGIGGRKYRFLLPAVSSEFSPGQTALGPKKLKQLPPSHL